MKQPLRASLLAVALVLATSAAAQATTTRIPFSGTAALVGGEEGVFVPAGRTLHINGMKLVYEQHFGNPMTDGFLTVTVNIVFGGGTKGDAMWGTEELRPTAYPGEYFTCTMSGNWDQDFVMQADDLCFGHGAHLDGWQYRSHIYNESEITGYLVRPGN